MPTNPMLLMANPSQWLASATGVPPVSQLKLLLTLGIVVAVWVVQQLVTAILVRQIKDVKTLYHSKKFAGYVTAGVGLIFMLRLWFEGVGDLATFFGLLSAGLAIAFKDPLTNLAGWAFILWRRPFMVGDRIQLANHRGDVIDQRLFAFSLMEIGEWVDADHSTGRVVSIPNGKIFTESLANYSSGFSYIWIEVPVLITFESDWQQAKTILKDVADEKALHLSKAAEKRLREASRKMMIFYSKLTPVVYTSVKDSGVMLTIRCLCEPRQRRGMEQTLWEAILLKFADADNIDFAYPSQRVFFNPMEGKPEARAELGLQGDALPAASHSKVPSP